LGGEWSPTTFQAGPNFYIGNNLAANGVYRPLVPGHETPLYERADAQRLAEQAEGRTLSAREVSRYWMTRAWTEIRQQPQHWLQLMALKSLMVVNHFEVPDVESMVVYAQFSAPLKWFGWALHFGILLPLAVWGFAVTVRQWQPLWFYHLLILVMIAAVVLFFIMGRYRHPLVPLLIPLAAVGLASIWQILRARNWKSALAPAIAAGIAAVVSNVTVHDESMLNASCFMNMGVAAGQAGDMGTCLHWLQHAIAEHPEMPEAHVNLARAWSISGVPRQAIVSYRNALRLAPDLISVDFYLAQSLEQVGDFEAALRHYRRALQQDPQDEVSQAAITRLTVRTGG
jgi:tetratricopeptide (TPR) repeat protein